MFFPYFKAFPGDSLTFAITQSSSFVLQKKGVKGLNFYSKLLITQNKILVLYWTSNLLPFVIFLKTGRPFIRTTFLNGKWFFFSVARRAWPKKIRVEMSKSEFISKVPAMIHDQIDGIGILKVHSYLEKNITVWYQFDLFASSRDFPKLLPFYRGILPYSYRATFNLQVIGGVPVEQIASKLNLSIDSVNYNLQKAREELKKSLIGRYSVKI